VTDEEMGRVKSLEMDKGLHLLGFRSRGSLRWEDNLRAPYFVYPDEQALRGSTLTFTAFWERMLEQDRVAVCAMRQRTNVAPRLVALVPARERRDGAGRVVSPSGMHVVSLPFSDDVRTIPPHPTAGDVPEAAVVAAEEIIKRFQLCDCRGFENPQLYRHFKHLEAISLEERVDEADLREVEESIMPDPEEFDGDEVRALFRGFKDAIDPDYDAKAQLGGGGGGAGAKRKREPKPDAGPADPGLPALVAGGGLEKLTVDRLKEHCRTLGLPVSGKKADLVQRIADKVGKP
jgi:ATP-dependent DNA helicase 2 subunit 1